MDKLIFQPSLHDQSLEFHSPVDNPQQWNTATNIMYHRTGILKQIGKVHLVECQSANGKTFHIHARSALKNPTLGMRVFVSEHLNINGQMEWLLTSHPILKSENNINFVNFGHKNHHLRVDYYTGESCVIKT
jgi:hypothetical protein